MYRVALNVVAWFLKNMPLLGITVLMVLVINHFNQNQERIITWQRIHGEHSQLVQDVLSQTDSRLQATGQSLEELRTTLYRVTLVINALQSSAERVDKVRDKEVQRLLHRAEILKKQLHLERDAAKLRSIATKKQLFAYKKQLERLRALQRIKDKQLKQHRRPLDL